MKVIHFREARSYEPEEGWRRVSLCDEKGISVEYFIKPPRHSSPMHHHPQEQVMVVLKGKLKIVSSDGREEVLEEGDAVFIPSDEPHRVENVLEEPSIGIDIFTPGRSFDFWLKRRG